MGCEPYAICGACAPGWDIGCIAEEWHDAEDAAQFLPDGTVNIINQTVYELGTTCQSCDQCQSNGQGTPIPFMLNGECYWSAIFGTAYQGDCVTSAFANEEGRVLEWTLTEYGLMANINLTHPDPNWRDVIDCSGTFRPLF